MNARMRFERLRLSGDGFVNPRTSSGLSPESIRELALHIGSHGLLNPLIVTSDGMVIAGQRRYLAIEWLIQWFTTQQEPHHQPAQDYDAASRAIAGLSHENVSELERRAREFADGIPVRVVSGTGLDGVALAENLQREDLSSYEVARHLSHLSSHGITGAELARLIGKSAAWVSRKLASYKGAGPELRAVWERGEMAEDAVQELAHLTHEQQAKALANDRPRRGPANRPGITTVKDALRDLIAAGRRQNASTSQQQTYASGVRDALRWVTGERTSPGFVALISDEEQES